MIGTHWVLDFLGVLPLVDPYQIKQIVGWILMIIIKFWRMEYANTIQILAYSSPNIWCVWVFIQDDIQITTSGKCQYNWIRDTAIFI